MFKLFAVYFSFVLLIVAFNVECSEEYTDDIFGELFYDTSAESVQSSEVDSDEHQPIFDNGLWKCGNCDVAERSSLMYTEDNEFDTDVSDNLPAQLQVALSLDNMQCITVDVSSSSRVTLTRVSGSCVGDHVTLELTAYTATNFTVHVYGDEVK